VVRRCVWSRNLVNEEAMARVGRSAEGKQKHLIFINAFKKKKNWKDFH